MGEKLSVVAMKLRAHYKDVFEALVERAPAPEAAPSVSVEEASIRKKEEKEEVHYHENVKVRFHDYLSISLCTTSLVAQEEYQKSSGPE